MKLTAAPFSTSPQNAAYAACGPHVYQQSNRFETGNTHCNFPSNDSFFSFKLTPLELDKFWKKEKESENAKTTRSY
jgi:hypothetical protein